MQILIEAETINYQKKEETVLWKITFFLGIEIVCGFIFNDKNFDLCSTIKV